MAVSIRKKREKDWLDADGNFLFGRHKGRPATEVAATNASYLRWIVDDVDDCAGGDRKIFAALLNRQGQGS